MTAVDSLMLDAKQAILEEHHRRFQSLYQEGRREEALQQIHVTLSCAADLLNESFESWTKPSMKPSLIPQMVPFLLPRPHRKSAAVPSKNKICKIMVSFRNYCLAIREILFLKRGRSTAFYPVM